MKIISINADDGLTVNFSIKEAELIANCYAELLVGINVLSGKLDRRAMVINPKNKEHALKLLKDEYEYLLDRLEDAGIMQGFSEAISPYLDAMDDV